MSFGFYLSISIVIIGIGWLIYEYGLKDGLNSVFRILPIAIAGVLLERLIDKQFDIVSIILGGIIIIWIPVYLLIRKNLIEDKPLAKASGRKKPKKRK